MPRRNVYRDLLIRILQQTRAGAIDYDEVPKELLSEAAELCDFDIDSLPPIILGADLSSLGAKWHKEGDE